jgi:Neprosin
VTRPVVLGAEHSLVELEAQLGPGSSRHAVELGVRTAPIDYGDGDPHLFVFAWVAGRRTCYDRCGWQGVRASMRPGDGLAGRVGTEITLGLVLHQGAWWAWMDSEWLGAFPLDVWSGALSEADGLQWFGEVFAPDERPRSGMGTGLPAAAPGAATVRGLCHVPWDRWACVEEERPQLRADAPSRYGVVFRDDGTLTYGGPGEPPALTPRPPPSSASGGTPPATGR